MSEPSPSRPPLRVLHVIGGVSTSYGGPTAALLELLKLLHGGPVKIGVAVATAVSADEPILAQIRAASDSVHSFDREPLHPFAFSWRFSRRFPELARGYDLMHVHGMWNWAPYFALREARRVGMPAIIRPAGALDEFDLRKHRLLKRVLGPLLLRRLFDPPNLFHCTAGREAERLVTYGGAARREILPLPLAENPDLMKYSRAEARAELGLAPDAGVVLFLGRLNYKKGLEILLPALALARGAVPQLVFLLAGEGDREIREMVEGLVRELGLAPIVRQLGFVSGARKAATLRASDLLALPSMNENFGMSVVEALQAGLPVLISPEVYLADDIAGNAAVLVCARTPAAVADGIVGMLAGPRSREDGARAARGLWEARYSPTALRGRYRQFYAEAAAGGSNHESSP